MLVPFLLPPRVEVAAGDNIVRDAFLVEGGEGIFVRDKAVAAELLLGFRRFLESLRVLLEERVVGAPLALNERVADEHLAGQFPGGVGADGVEEDLAVGHQRHAVERHLLLAHGGAIA